jgi:hypothetical protein
LSKVWNGGKCCDLHDLWLVMLESAKDRVLGVDTPGQLVPPRVQYGTACLIIRDVVGSVPCSDEWEIGIVTVNTFDHMCGTIDPGSCIR